MDVIMDSYDGSCEIVEADAEFGIQHSRGPYEPQRGLDAVGREKKPPLSKMGYRNSLENDINTLFEAISLKSSSKGIDLSDQPGTSISPMKKSAFKKPITVGMPQSPRVGTPEQVSLKQALRDLCISKASEMASMKRLSKSSGSPGYSEAGRIKSLYNSVVIEASRKSDIPQYEGKGRISGISMAPDERTSHSTSKLDRQLPNLHIMSSGRSTFSSSGVAEQETVRVAETTLKETGVSTSKEIGSRESIVGTLEECDEVVSPGGCLNASESKKSGLDSPKLPKKQSATRLVRKARRQSMTSSTSNNGNKVSKVTRNVPRVAKHVLRNKHTIKRKTKKELASKADTPNAADEVNVSLDPSSNQLVCQRCQCALNHTSNESKQEFEVSPPSASGNAEVSSTKANPVVGGTNLSANNSSRNRTSVLKAKENPKSKPKGEFSQSSSSLGDSSSTSLSDDSNVSGSSCGNKPHMSKDVRWEAIHQIKIHYGALSLSHFNLLKKLGCGDIGTVYLAELIATNCLFAIKVMDNEFLARRKKTPRAQTEREILRMLDHPFLPTLYTQFTSDNLSCLVMEYCPGGDLHVLRQKQPGRCFHEPAARFYVAEVLLALEYLHMLGVIYRDLKPENILVREDGHIMLTDFDLSLRCNVNPTLLQSSSTLDPARISGPCRGSSCIDPFCIEPTCQMSCFSPRFFPAASRTRKLKSDLAARVRLLPQLVAEPTEARSNSFVGTHEYLAPEIIKGEGHGAAVDWWTFGVLLYELLYGRTPFKGPGNEETLANVVLQSLKFPDSPLVSFQARDLIKLLLVKEPENRLGTQRGAAEIKQHPFFDGLNWALIRCAVPPELPDLYEYGVPSMASPGTSSQYLDCKATREHLEFELF